MTGMCARRRTISLLLCLALTVPVRSQDVRFAWLTDTHVGGATGAEDLRASVRDINKFPGVDFVILSGDITEYGSDLQLRQAKSILDSLRIPYHIVPGNHDTKWSSSGGTTFRSLWGDDRFVFRSGPYTFIGLHQGPRMKMADGHWAPEDLRWLDSVLVSFVDQNSPFFVVTHYPVDSSIANWYEVLDRVRRFNVQGFLVGHGHRQRLERYEGIPGIMNRSNLRGDDSVGGYAVCTIARETLSVCERRPGLASNSPWAVLPLGKKEYPPAPRDAGRPDTSVNALYPGIGKIWVYYSGYTIAASAAVDTSSVIFGDASGKITCLNLQDGSQRWVNVTGGPVFSTPAIGSGMVFFGSTDSTIRCLRIADGKEVWRFRTASPVVASPVVDGGEVFVGSSDGFFRCLDSRTGSLRWKSPPVGGFVECRPLVQEGRVLFGVWDGGFYALDRSTGKILWRWYGERRDVLFSPAACWPVGSNGRIFIVAPDRKMTCLDESTGREIWRSAAHQVRETIGMSRDGARVYVRTMRDSILALDSRADGPVTLWCATPGFGYDINSAMIVERDGAVYYATKNGLLFALDAPTGALLWVHRVGPATVHTVVPAEGGRVVTTDFDGRVALVGPR